MRRRTRPHLFTAPFRDILRAIAVFILLAIVLWSLRDFGAPL